MAPPSTQGPRSAASILQSLCAPDTRGRCKIIIIIIKRNQNWWNIGANLLANVPKIRTWIFLCVCIQTMCVSKCVCKCAPLVMWRLFLPLHSFTGPARLTLQPLKNDSTRSVQVILGYVYLYGWWRFMDSKMALDRKCVNTREGKKMQRWTDRAVLQWRLVTVQIMAKFIHWRGRQKDEQVRLMMVVHCPKSKCSLFCLMSHLLEVELNGAAAILVHLIEDSWERAEDESSSDLASEFPFKASLRGGCLSWSETQPQGDWIWSIITAALAAWSVWPSDPP